jgi:ABC-type multidrug transport system fused ATPase/permease subunit
MRIAYFDSMLHKDISWYDTHEPASLATEISDDVEKVSECFGDKFGSAVMGFGGFVAGFIFAFVLGWQLALVMVATVPFMAMGTICMGAAMEEIMFETQGWYAEAAKIVEETLFAMRTVIAFGGEKK